ncbi:response regulator [Catelliglobosispora koreensis]|uniref:response regulator n=1 Tax=Catelliglobosispora koreensis TaxID=129052 RepID=UPI00037CD20A|nr:response regulator transcription factor [Catelliglobosispora koreensis]
MIRVLIVDDEALVRSGLRMILEAAGDIAVVAEARDGNEAVEAVVRHRPQVVLMDVRMPGRDGLSAAEELNQQPDPPKIVMLTTFDIDEYVHRALRAGAVGFLLKDTPPKDLAEAVRTVAAGNAMLSPTVTRRLISSFASKGPSLAHNARQRLTVLTDREMEVVSQAGLGLSNAEIARQLDMAETTVKAHMSRALAKLGLSNRVQAAILIHDAELS